MQKDFHYYMAYALALKAGIQKDVARCIAWSNQFTDECTNPELYGIRTQCGREGLWLDRTVQQDVIIPFHFLPGGVGDNPWVVRAESDIIALLLSGCGNNPYSFGIALHSIQDTYSHQGWTGWQEKHNACYWFSLLPIPMPNIGHTDMGLAPDIMNMKWTDPRTGELIDNAVRGRRATMMTWSYYERYWVDKGDEEDSIINELDPFWKIKDYEKRKRWLMKWADFDVRFSDIKPGRDDLNEFARAARRQLSIVMNYISQF